MAKWHAVIYTYTKGPGSFAVFQYGSVRSSSRSACSRAVRNGGAIMSATHSRAVSRFACAGISDELPAVQSMDRPTSWASDRSAGTTFTTTPTYQKEAHTFAPISRGWMHSTPPAEMSLAEANGYEPIRADLNSASSSGSNIEK